MGDRFRGGARVVVIAAAVACAVFGLAGYGVFGPVQPTNAVLETTSQSPIEPQATPAPIRGSGTNPSTPPGAWAPGAWAPLLVTLVLVAGAGGWYWRRRRSSVR